MSGNMYIRVIVPIGVLYSGSLVCSNLPYLTLSVAFIQMLKVRTKRFQRSCSVVDRSTLDVADMELHDRA